MTNNEKLEDALKRIALIAILFMAGCSDEEKKAAYMAQCETEGYSKMYCLTAYDAYCDCIHCCRFPKESD